MGSVSIYIGGDPLSPLPDSTADSTLQSSSQPLPPTPPNLGRGKRTKRPSILLHDYLWHTTQAHPPLHTAIPLAQGALLLILFLVNLFLLHIQAF